MQLDNHGDGFEQRLLPLLHGVDKPLGGIEFLLDEQQCVALVARLVLLVRGVVFEHVLIVAAHVQLGHVAVVEADGELAVLGLDVEVGYDVVLGVARVAVVPGATRLGVELGDFPNGLFQLLFAHVALAHDFVVVFFGKFVEHLVDNLVGQQVGGCPLVTFELQQQAFAQVRSPHAGGLELLNHLQNILDLTHRYIEPHLKDEVVGDGLYGALQVAVVVDVADDVLGYLVGGVVERQFAQLAFEVVVERRGRDKGYVVFFVVL